MGAFAHPIVIFTLLDLFVLLEFLLGLLGALGLVVGRLLLFLLFLFFGFRVDLFSGSGEFHDFPDLLLVLALFALDELEEALFFVDGLWIGHLCVSW